MNERTWLNVEPDKRYDIGSVNVRIDDVPLGISFEAMEFLCQPQIQKAIDQFERLGHWKFYDRIPIEYDLSMIHRADVDRLNRELLKPERIWQKADSAAAAPVHYLGDTVSVIAKVWFIRPLTWVNLDEEREYKESLGYAQGFVPRADMPEGSLPND